LGGAVASELQAVAVRIRIPPTTLQKLREVNEMAQQRRAVQKTHEAAAGMLGINSTCRKEGLAEGVLTKKGGTKDTGGGAGMWGIGFGLCSRA
jgi:hypothetical protein